MDITVILLRSMFFYFLIFIVIRFLGKRELGQLQIFDLIILLIVADIATIALENINNSFWLSTIIIVFLTLIQKLISYITLKIRYLRLRVEGKPSIIIFNGKINYEEMKRQLYSLDDLLVQLRINSIRSIKQVEIAILEANGSLTVFKYENQVIPLPVIVNDRIMEDNLPYLKVNLERIKQLKEKYRKSIYCAFYYNNELLVIECFKGSLEKDNR